MDDTIVVDGKETELCDAVTTRHCGTGVCVGVVALGKDSGYSGFLGHILMLLRNKCDLGEKM